MPEPLALRLDDGWGAAPGVVLGPGHHRRKRYWEKQFALKLMLEWDRFWVLGHPDLKNISAERLGLIMKRAGWVDVIVYETSVTQDT